MRCSYCPLVLPFLLALFAAQTSAAPNVPSDSPRPNVLFIAVDDMRDWTACLGGYDGQVFTPHIDRLAARGTLFTNAHTASPVCCPSRAAVMSGRRPSSTGVYNNSHWWKPHRPDLVTIPRHFRQNGYTAVGAGKLFHHTVGNNPPNQWDDFHRLVFNDDAWTRTQERYRSLYPFTKPKPVPDAFPYSGLQLYSPEVDWGVLPLAEADYDDTQSVAYAERFLESGPDKPFFLAVGTFRPHLPWYTPQKYVDLYPQADIQLPVVPEDDLDDVPEAGRKLALRKSEDLKKVRDAGQWRRAVQMYLASISFADAQVGRLLDALDASPFVDNTIVVLWSDHGWHLGEKGHWHKRTLWEEGTRVPLIIAAPDVGRPNSRCNRPASLVDLFPTLIDLCGLSEVAQLDGCSLRPQLLDPSSPRPQPAIIQDENRHVAVRDERYRYIRYKDGTEELYDHRTDPNEWNNRADDVQLAEVKSKLSRWVTQDWAEAAPSKKAYDFDPTTYTWTHKATGRVIHGQ